MERNEIRVCFDVCFSFDSFAIWDFDKYDKHSKSYYSIVVIELH